LWTALRSLEESAALARRMAEQAEQRGYARAAARFREQVKDAEQHALSIREVLLSRKVFAPTDLPPEEKAGEPAPGGAGAGPVEEAETPGTGRAPLRANRELTPPPAGTPKIRTPLAGRWRLCYSERAPGVPARRPDPLQAAGNVGRPRRVRPRPPEELS